MSEAISDFSFLILDLRIEFLRKRPTRSKYKSALHLINSLYYLSVGFLFWCVAVLFLMNIFTTFLFIKILRFWDFGFPKTDGRTALYHFLYLPTQSLRVFNHRYNLGTRIGYSCRRTRSMNDVP